MEVHASETTKFMAWPGRDFHVLHQSSIGGLANSLSKFFASCFVAENKIKALNKEWNESCVISLHRYDRCVR
jgi:hypothetical protein